MVMVVVGIKDNDDAHVACVKCLDFCNHSINFYTFHNYVFNCINYTTLSEGYN